MWPLGYTLAPAAGPSMPWGLTESTASGGAAGSKPGARVASAAPSTRRSGHSHM